MRAHAWKIQTEPNRANEGQKKLNMHEGISNYSKQMYFLQFLEIKESKTHLKHQNCKSHEHILKIAADEEKQRLNWNGEACKELTNESMNLQKKHG